MAERSPVRTAKYERKTRETRVQVELCLDGSGKGDILTGIGFLDHMLDSMARHGLLDLTIRGSGDLEVDQHHLVEDTAIGLGRALDKALGQRAGIRRMAHAVIPMDEALVLVAVDLSGRAHATIDLPLSGETIGSLSSQMVSHFLQTMAAEARMTLHVQVLRAGNDHHTVEAAFKALAKALDQACQVDPRLEGRVPSAKDTLESPPAMG